MGTESAIQPDVQTNPKSEEAPVKTARELALEAIEARHHNDLAQQNGYDPVLLAEDPDNAPPADETPPAAQQTPPAEETPPTPDQQLTQQMTQDDKSTALPQSIKVKVDGHEDEVPLDELVRNYQKGAAADKRLQEATRLLREAQEVSAQRALAEEQLRLQQTQQQVAPAATPAQTESAPAPDVKVLGKELLDGLFTGDEEKALAALEKVLSAGRRPEAPAQPTLDVNQLTQTVAQQVQQKLTLESALAQHRKDYPHIYADPDLEAFTLTKLHRLRQDQGLDFLSALKQASDDVTKLVKPAAPASDEGRPAADTTPPTTPSMQAKLERKAAIDNVAAVNTKTGSTEQTPETPSDVIAEMRRQRGHV